MNFTTVSSCQDDSSHGALLTFIVLNLSKVARTKKLRISPKITSAHKVAVRIPVDVADVKS